MLGSTADIYFSPALEQLANDMGLPPRFAGVTLLALGNGAPDVSATMSAIDAGDFELSLSALTGAGMFVGTVVAGVVIVIAGGVRARGALTRRAAAAADTRRRSRQLAEAGRGRACGRTSGERESARALGTQLASRCWVVGVRMPSSPRRRARRRDDP